MLNCVETLAGGTRVWVGPTHTFGADALLLAGFCRPAPGQAAADLGSGCGIVALAWHDAGHRGPCTAVEMQPEAVALLRQGAAQPGAGHIQPVQADLRDFARERPENCRVVACNPPYYSAGAPSPNPARAAARHEICCTLVDVAACAERLLCNGGRLAVCYPPFRLAELLGVLCAAGLEPKRLQFVKKAPDAAPWLVLCEAQKQRKPGLQVLPDAIVPGGCVPPAE